MTTTDRTLRSPAAISHRAARITAAWVLLAMLCAAGISVTADGPAAARPLDRYNPCGDREGITVVVDFQGEGGRGLEAGCATGSPATGLEALRSAGFPYEPSLEFVTAVCRIEGLPTPSQDRCVKMPPASAYWSYWHAPAGGSWTLSSTGGATRTPSPGNVEGWSFSRGKSASKTPPPRRWTPPAPAPTTTPPTSPPATSAPGTGSTGGGSTGSGSGSGSSSGGSQSGGPANGGASPPDPGSKPAADGSTKPGEGATPGKNGTAASDDPVAADEKTDKPGKATPGDDAGGKANSDDPDGPSAGAGAGSGGGEMATGRAADGQSQDIAANQRGANSADEDSGSPLPLVFAVVAAVALLGIGVRASRRNRAAS